MYNLMHDSTKKEFKFLNTFKESINDPFLILDDSGHVLAYNNNAKSLFRLDGDLLSIYSIFDVESANKIYINFSEIEVDTPSTLKINLVLQNGSSLNFDLILNKYKNDNINFILATFVPNKLDYNDQNINSFNLDTEKQKFFLSDEIKEKLEFIKANYPLTFVNKEKIKKEINKLEDAFWLKNNKGKLVLVNDAFANLIKIKAEILEGKMEHDLIDMSLAAFFTFIESFTILSKSSLIVEKFPFRSLASNVTNINTLIIPLIDSDKNVLAIVGISKKVSDLKDKKIIERSMMADLLIINNPDPIFVYNKDNLTFIEVNPAAEALFGYSKAEFMEMDLTDLYLPEDFQNLLDDTLFEEGKFSGPFKQVTKDRTVLQVEICRIPYNYNGEEAVVNIIRDISNNIDLEKKFNSYKALFHTSEAICFIVDDSGFIKEANNSALSKLNYSLPELINTSISTLVRDEERILIGSLLTRKEKGNITVNIRRNDKSYVHSSLTFTPIESNLYSISALPLSNGKQKEVEKIIVREKPSVSSNKEFFSNVFHEILTPINSILAFSQDLTESINTLSDEQKEASEIIKQSRDSLLSTMNTVVEYSQIEAKSISFEIKELNFNKIISDLDKTLIHIKDFYNKEITQGEIESNLILHSDEEKFKKFLDLLLKITGQLSKDNSIKINAYTISKEDFIISFSFSAEHHYDQMLKIYNRIFIDKKSDLGISKLTIKLTQALSSILSGVFRDDYSRSKYELCFQFPKVLKNIDTITEEGNETKKHEKNEEVIIKKELDLSSLSCLYIEDQTDAQILFKVQMKELKEIKYAISFEEALPELESNQFDFIVMDINLQGEYNGLEALRIIRRMPRYSRVPIIAVTAYLLEGDTEKFLEAGFTDFISKPVFKANIIDSLKKIFI